PHTVSATVWGIIVSDANQLPLQPLFVSITCGTAPKAPHFRRLSLNNLRNYLKNTPLPQIISISCGKFANSPIIHLASFLKVEDSKYQRI
ncbi:MAG: hypothetical protein U0L43_07185, partial [Muribaculaceae bacterium]|nr:hypothetical protein [Muribaculaceae bacterium]